MQPIGFRRNIYFEWLEEIAARCCRSSIRCYQSSLRSEEGAIP